MKSSNFHSKPITIGIFLAFLLCLLLLPSPTLAQITADLMSIDAQTPAADATIGNPDPTTRYPYVKDGNIWVTDLRGASRRQLTFNGRNSDAVASPAGAFVAYLSIPREFLGAAPSPQDVCIVAIAGSQAPRCLSAGPALRGKPVWSPDGTSVLYVENGALVKAELTGQKTELTTNVAREELSFSDVAWSPDGRSIACTLAGSRGPELWVVNPQTGPEHLVMHWPEGVSSPLGFTPDGQSLTFINASDSDRLWTVEIDRGEMHGPVSSASKVRSFAWSQDAAQIAFLTKDGAVWTQVLQEESNTRNIRRSAPGQALSEIEWIGEADTLLLTSSTGTELTIVSPTSGVMTELVPPSQLDKLDQPDDFLPEADLYVPYRYQGSSESGACSSVNCGPTAVAMAIQSARNQIVPISDIRNNISGSNCTTLTASQLIPALSHWGVSNATITGMDAVRDAINQRGHIVIVPVMMSYIRTGADYESGYSDPANRYDRYYSYGGGHFVVAKGISSDGNWVIVHDPNVWSRNIYWYSNGTAKGQSRYYSYSRFAAAFAAMNSPAIEIGTSSAPPPAPSAEFDAWPQSGQAPLSSSMHIVSTANITSCQWDYGDGTSGSSCSSSHNHTYNSPGQYTVRLTVHGPGGSDTRTRSGYITVSGSRPTANFDASPLSGQAPLTVRMHNTSSGSVSSCAWDYGDGTSGNSCSAYHDHTYTSQGTYTVRLTVSGSGGSDTKTNSGYITVSGSANPSNCADGEGVILYEHPNYQGRCSRFLGDDRWVGDNNIGNDAVSSVRVIGNFQAVLYEHSDYGGVSSTFTGDDPDLGNDAIGHDRTSSVRVQRRDAGGNSNCDGGPGAYLYEHPSYTGRCSKFTGDSPNPRSWYLGNDAASSIRFVGNYEATVYENDDYNGASSRFTGDDPDFGNDTIGHDRASSIQVRPRSSGGTSNCDGGEGAYLYEHPSYQGRCSKFSADSPNPGNWFIGNDAASSIRLIGNYQATVYEHDNYNGASTSFSSDDPDFGHDSIGHDRTSSIRVQQRSSGPSSCPDGQFLIEYYANPDLSGSPAVRRCDGVNAGAGEYWWGYDWGYGGPAGVGADKFSLRATGRVWSSPGTNLFTTMTDDGVRLWVDNQLLIDQWHDMGATPFNNDRWLSEGLHTIRFEYYERAGYARVRLSWSPVAYGHDSDDNRTIGYGQGLDGTISPAGDRDDYYFDGSSGQAITIRMDKRDSNIDSYVELYNPDGSLLGRDDDNGGNGNARLAITLSQNGRHKIIAREHGSRTGGYRLSLSRESAADPDDNRWIAFGNTLQGTISPNDDRDWYYFSGTAGRAISIQKRRVDGDLDSFLELYNPAGVKVAENDDGLGDRNSWIVYTLPAGGTYRILARSFNLASSGRYNLSITSVSNANLAQGKPVAVSSVEFSGVEGWRATDGNTSTRWSSRYSDPQWIYVDLGQDRTFNQVVLKWETAYGKRFGIYYATSSMCNSCWEGIYGTNIGRGGTNTINFNPVRARYVLMYGAERGTQYGYSLWEFEVYDNTALVLPIVPPDPGDKPPETVDQIAPLAPNDPGKETLLLGEGDTGQEETPLAGESPAAPTVEGQSGAPSAFILYPNSPDVTGELILFQGVASDNDEEGQAIEEYRWTSSIDGLIGTTSLFTMLPTDLSRGRHVITFQARDDEGIWSEPVTTELLVGPGKLYLPLVTK